MPTIYIAGPMSGLLKDNFPLFFATEEKLKAANYKVINPARNAPPDVIKKSRKMGAAFRETKEYRALIQVGMEQVAQCDGVCTLTNWQHSRGASLEVSYAEALGLPRNPVDWWIQQPVPTMKWVGETRSAPVRGYPGDAGIDLVVSETTRIGTNMFADVPLGLCIELPPGVWGMLTGRSSTLRKRGLLVTQGIIDNGYRGPLYAGVQNMRAGEAVVREGDRIAQLIPIRLETEVLQIWQAEKLSPSDRGENGFGSTGS